MAEIYFELGKIDDSIEMLKKTIEKNKNDIEAVKLLVQILIKENKKQQAQEFLETLLQEKPNGDLFYLLSKSYEGLDEEKYQTALSLALENKETLSYEFKSVKGEFELSKENFKENNE